MGKYYSSSASTQEDNSVTLAGDAEVVTGTGGITALPQSLVVSPGSSVGNVTFEEFTPSVQRSISDLVGAVESSVFAGSRIAEAAAEQSMQSQTILAASNKAAQTALADKLRTTEQGAASALPETAKYLAILVVVVLVGKAVLK